MDAVAKYIMEGVVLVSDLKIFVLSVNHGKRDWQLLTIYCLILLFLDSLAIFYRILNVTGL